MLVVYHARAADTAPSSRASTPCSPGPCLPGRTAPAADRSRRAREICAGRRRTIRRRRRSTGRVGRWPGRSRWRTRRPPSCHQPCVRPVSSRSFAGSLKKIWQETAKTCASAKPSSSGARKSGSTRMSLLSSTTIRSSRRGIPRSIRRRSPDSSVERHQLHFAESAARTNSALPSVEPLSTTTISLPGLPASASTTDGRYFSSKSLPFQLGITTEAARVRGARIVRAAFAGDAPKASHSKIGDRQRQGADRHQERREQQQRQRAQQAFQEGHVISARRSAGPSRPHVRPSCTQRDAANQWPAAGEPARA